MSQRTPLYDVHVRAGARMVEFAGWEMPVQYAGILEEHEAVRTRVGLFDVSHMGEVVFRGPRALEALNRLFTNDLSKIADGQAQYGCLCRETGGIVDDVVVYRRAADDLLVCVNAGNRQKDFEWLAGHAGGADVRNESDDWAQLALQGPLAAQLLQRLTALDLSPIRSYRFGDGDVAGVPCLVARTGYTGEDGFELFCGPEAASRALGRAHRGRRARGDPAVRPRRARLAAARDGLPPLRLRHGRRHDAARGGAGLGREARQGRLHRARRARAPEGAGPRAEARRLRPDRARASRATATRCCRTGGRSAR